MATDIGLKRFRYFFTWNFILYLTVLCACVECFVAYFFYNNLYCKSITCMNFITLVSPTSHLITMHYIFNGFTVIFFLHVIV